MTFDVILTLPLQEKDETSPGFVLFFLLCITLKLENKSYLCSLPNCFGISALTIISLDAL